MSASSSHRGIPDDEDDPIVNSFDVFIKPKLPEGKELVLLQYVTKRAQNPDDIAPPHVLEMRVKPKSGFYEVDVPIDVSQAYDKPKGMAWGESLQKSKESRKGGGHGLAAGFNLIPTSQSGSRGGRRGANAGDDQPQITWQEARRLDRVLQKQTFGGNRSANVLTKDMVGVFQGQNLHLTPISSIVMMGPQHHHIDAATEQERLNRPNPAAGGPGGAGGDKAGGKAIQMTIKSADNSDGVVSESIIDRMHAIQKEPWKKMDWAHSDSPAAWEAYQERLLLHSRRDEEDGEGVKGKSVEDTNDNTVSDDSGAPDLAKKVPHLKTDWTEKDLTKSDWN
ncbi:DNA-directed RNA polymerase [Cladorrhinum sp. PSN259]|nr:DNA-directed RNA polymerase [Cladorrhinum sp. PSN259]